MDLDVATPGRLPAIAGHHPPPVSSPPPLRPVALVLRPSVASMRSERPWGLAGARSNRAWHTARRLPPHVAMLPPPSHRLPPILHPPPLPPTAAARTWCRTGVLPDGREEHLPPTPLLPKSQSKSPETLPYHPPLLLTSMLSLPPFALRRSNPPGAAPQIHIWWLMLRFMDPATLVVLDCMLVDFSRSGYTCSPG